MCAVVAHPHPKWDERPVAVVTLVAPARAVPHGASALAQKVIAHCAAAFAKYELPDDVLVWDEIPTTATGKLDKKAVRARLEREGYVLPSLRVSKL